MRTVAVGLLVVVQLLAVYWLHDPELIGLCAAAAFLMLFTGGRRHAR